MDYEKKYKEALERARIYRNNAKAVEEYSAVARYENIFPELHEEEKPLTPFQQCLNCILRGVYYAEVPDKKVNEFILNVVRTRTDELIKLAKRHEDTDCQFRENEDERIRKALIDALKVSETIGELKFRLPYPTREECIAYLEKQKESLHIQETCKENTDSFTSEDEKIRKEIIDFLETIPASELKRIPRPISEWFSWLEKQKERGPLTKEEEYTLQRIIEYLEDETCPPEWISLLHDIYCLPYEKQKGQKPAVSREEILHQLLQNGSITLSDYLYLTEKQKPAEWSEEDESELTAVICCVSRAIKASKDENERNSLLSAKKWLRDKLSFRVKFLRPSWKPSDEQMGALKELIDDANRSGWVTPGATELYEQLKKL